MPRTIIKLRHEGTDYYLEWSSIVDAPVTYGMPFEEFTEYYRERYGGDGLTRFAERMERVRATGTSTHYGDSAEEFVAYNRAGPEESCLTLEGIILGYITLRHLDQKEDWAEQLKPFIRPEEEYRDV